MSFTEKLAGDIPQGTKIRIGSLKDATFMWYTVVGKTLMDDVLVRKESDNTMLEIHPKTIVLIETKIEARPILLGQENPMPPFDIGVHLSNYKRHKKNNM